MYTEKALVIEWDDNIKINVVYLINKDLDEPDGYLLYYYRIESLVVDGREFKHESFTEYLCYIMNDKHQDYIWAACCEDYAAYLDQKGS